MVIKLLVSLWGLLLSIASLAPAQQSDFIIDRYDTEHGLPYHEVRDIEQDERGYIWIGTEYGLSRFDGSQFLNYRHDPKDSATLCGPEIRDLMLDSKGDLWVAGTGLSRYNQEAGNFQQYLYDPQEDLTNKNQENPNYYYSMAEGPEGRIWLTSIAGLVSFNPVQQTFQLHRTEWGVKYAKLCIDVKNRRLYIGTTEGLLGYRIHADGGLEKEISVPKSEFPGTSNRRFRLNALYQAPSQNLWICTEQGLYKLKDETVIPYSGLEKLVYNPNKSWRVKDLKVDQDGNFWTLAGLELLVFNPETNQLLKSAVLHPPSEAYFYLNKLHLSEDGTGWVGSRAGLYKLRPQPFRHYIHDREDTNSLSDYDVYALAEDREGKIWVGTTKGLDQLDPESGSIRHFFDHWPDQNTMEPRPEKIRQEKNVSVLAFTPTGKLVIGVWEKPAGYFELDQETEQITAWEASEKSDEYFLHAKAAKGLAIDPNGNPWIGNSRGWGRYNKAKKDIFKPAGQKKKTVRAMLAMGNTLWIGENSYLINYDLQRDKIDTTYYPFGKNNLIERFIYVLYPAGKDLLWIGTHGGGICIFDIKAGRIIDTLTHLDGLPNNHIRGITRDDFGDFWISTNQGISRYDAETGIFTNYDLDDGLPFEAFNPGATLKATDGSIWFGGKSGLISFHPEDLHIKAEDAASEINLTRVAVNGKPYVPDTGRNTATIILNPDQNYFEVSFTALNHQWPKKLEYRYRLQGWDQDWMYTTGTASFARYSNVAPGKYQLQVQVKGPGQSWAQTNSIRLNSWPVHIQPKFFERLEVRVAILLIVLSVLALILYLWTRQARLRKREQQLLIEGKEANLQALRSQMNPHFIFNSLNSINKYISRNDQESANRYLVEFARLMRLTMEHSKLELISLKQELELLNLYLSLEKSRMNEALEYEIRVGPGLKIADTQIPPMLIQPFVENAIWHGLQHKLEKGKLIVSFSKDQERLLCKVEDNGIGREKSAEINKRGGRKPKSAGMKNVMKRIENINQLKRTHIEASVLDLKDNAGNACGTKVELKMNLIQEPALSPA